MINSTRNFYGWRWWNPLGFAPDLSMRVGDNSIWGGSTLCCLTTTPQGLRCALATLTPPPICVVLAVPRTTLNLQANRRTNKNKWTSKQYTDLAQRVNLIHTSLGFWIKQTGSLINTHAHQEVAEAKLTTKQNPSAFWWLLLVYIGGRAARGCWGRNPNSNGPLVSASMIVIFVINLSSWRIWWWGLIHLKVDFMYFSTSTHLPQSTSGVKSYTWWKHLLCGRS